MDVQKQLARLVGEPAWRESEHVCAVADDSRHLGHAIQMEYRGAWHAYDATKLNAFGDGFKYLGQFDTAEEAKEAVDHSIVQSARSMMLRAGSTGL